MKKTFLLLVAFTAQINFGQSVFPTDGGNVGIGTLTPNSRLTVRLGTTGVSIHPGSGTNSYFGSLAFNRESATGEIFDNSAYAFQINNGNNVYDKSLHFQIYDSSGMQITNNALVISGATGGNIGIGTSTPDAKLAVNGTIHSREVKVDINFTTVPDYVFANDYNLRSLQEVENYVNQNSHLPEIPSAKEFEKNGIQLAEMNMALLKKVEELTLYAIEQDKKTDKLLKVIEQQNKRLEILEKLKRD